MRTLSRRELMRDTLAFLVAGKIPKKHPWFWDRDDYCDDQKRLHQMMRARLQKLTKRD